MTIWCRGSAGFQFSPSTAPLAFSCCTANDAMVLEPRWLCLLYSCCRPNGLRTPNSGARPHQFLFSADPLDHEESHNSRASRSYPLAYVCTFCVRHRPSPRGDTSGQRRVLARTLPRAAPCRMFARSGPAALRGCLLLLLPSLPPLRWVSCPAEVDHVGRFPLSRPSSRLDDQLRTGDRA